MTKTRLNIVTPLRLISSHWRFPEDRILHNKRLLSRNSLFQLQCSIFSANNRMFPRSENSRLPATTSFGSLRSCKKTQEFESFVLWVFLHDLRPGSHLVIWVIRVMQKDSEDKDSKSDPLFLGLFARPSRSKRNSVNQA